MNLHKLTALVKRLLSERSYKTRREFLVGRVTSRLNNLSGDTSSALTSTEKKEIDDYYRRFGLQPSTHNFHEFYKRVTGKFSPEYLTEDLYYHKIDRYFNDWDAAKYLDNKTLYRILFPDVPQPELLVFRQNGFWFDSAGQPMTESAMQGIVGKEEYLFVKAARESYGGHGVKYLRGKDVADYTTEYKEDVVIQKPLRQSALLAQINPSSVNTVRILTLLRKDGSVRICSKILRMGIGSAKVDNASSGGITVGINDDGTLKDTAYFVSGKKYKHHPTTGVKFSTVKLPSLDKAVSMVSRQANSLPYFRLVSWDIAFDETDNPVLIEANLCDGELDFHQINNGPVFGEETAEVLSEVFGLDACKKNG